MAKKISAVDEDREANESVVESDVQTTDDAAPEHTADAQPAVTVDDRDPGRGLGLVALIASIIVGPVGFVLGLVSYRRSRAAEFTSGMGMTAMIVGAVTTALIATYLLLAASGMGFGGACDGREAGVYRLDNGQTISCR